MDGTCHAWQISVKLSFEAMSQLKKAIQKAVSITGYELVNKSLAQKARDLPPALNLYNYLPFEKQKLIAQWLPYSQSQLAQDLFVLSELNDCSHENYFVEFGATDGLSLSNTHLLETKLGWQGVLAEPAKIWHKKLEAHRSCAIDTRCVYSESGKRLDFVEVGEEVKGGLAELSSLIECSDNGDWASKIRKSSRNIYEVETISLNDLLAEYKSPSIMSYLSIDTEGSELSVLRALDFSKYKFRVITVEHNYSKEYRGDIKCLLESNGYIRKYENLSCWDDWYILRS